MQSFVLFVRRCVVACLMAACVVPLLFASFAYAQEEATTPTNLKPKPDTSTHQTKPTENSAKPKPKPDTTTSPTKPKPTHTPTADKPAPTKPLKKATSHKTETAPVASIVPIVAPPVAEFSLEQKILIANATKLDNLNKELLKRNQELQLNNEKQSLHIEMLKHDRYSEGTRDTLITLFCGLVLGWLLFRTKKRPRYRDF